MGEFVPPPDAGVDGVSDDVAWARAYERLEANPNDVQAMETIGQILYRCGHFEEARAQLAKVLRKTDRNPSVLETLARCQILLGRKEEAVETLDLYFKHPKLTSEGRAWARKRMMVLMSDPGLQPGSPPPEPPPAPEPPPEPDPPPVFEPPPTPEPPTVPESTTVPAPARAVAGVCDRAGRAKLLKKLESQEIVTHCGYVDETQVESAREVYAQDPDNPAVIEWLAFVLHSCGKTADCIPLYRRVVEEFDATANSLYYLGSAYLRNLELREALNFWGQLRRDFPNHRLTRRSLAKIRRLASLRKTQPRTP